MEKIKDLRARAADCRTRAAAMDDADLRDTYEVLARHWDDLADTRTLRAPLYVAQDFARLVPIRGA
jgi:hypothetical protein